ncbi:MAG: hypothetical protein LBT55_06215 [Clostridiaceae bacterium]|jgi:hypothetical protein|nr:hypothetical protein [Clostridiaceae bacterium]
MKNETNSRILNVYFTAEGILKQFGADTESVFGELAAAYGLTDKKDISALYALTKKHQIAVADTVVRFERTEKLLHQCGKSGIESGFTDTERWAFLCKGSGIRRAAEAKLLSEHETDSAESVRLMEDAARNGDITALTVLGFMLANGIGAARNLPQAVKTLTKGEEWGNLDCALLLLRYDKKNIKKHFTFVNVLLKCDLHEELYKSIHTAYPGIDNTEENRDAELVLKCFAACVEGKERYNKQIYNPQAARVAYSARLSRTDKQKVLFSANKEVLSSVNELPLDMNVNNKNVEPSYAPFDGMRLKRENEADRVWTKVCGYGAAARPGFRPLLLVCRDRFILDMYRDAVAEAFAGAVVENIDAGGLTEKNVEPNRDNVVVQRVIESKNATVFVFDVTDKLSTNVVDGLVNMLSNEYMRKFKIHDLGITFDFSDMLIVLTAEEMPGAQLVNACDAVRLGSARDEEKGIILEEALNEWRIKYGEDILLTDEMKRIVCDSNASDIQDVVADIACHAKAKRLSGKADGVTEVAVKAIVNRFADNGAPFGFGGTLNNKGKA